MLNFIEFSQQFAGNQNIEFDSNSN